MLNYAGYISRTVVMLGILFCMPLVHAAPIQIMGTLQVIDDMGGAVYSGVDGSVMFTGFIDDETFSGQITGNGITTTFSCCMLAAGGLTVFNAEPGLELDADSVNLLNTVAGTNEFSVGELIDAVDIEGDALTGPGSNARIEIGVSYALFESVFDNNDPANYPFDPNDVRLGLFFIFEENEAGEEIFSAVGRLQPIPVPAAFWLFASGLLGMASMARRRG